MLHPNRLSQFITIIFIFIALYYIGYYGALIRSNFITEMGIDMKACHSGYNNVCVISGTLYLMFVSIGAVILIQIISKVFM